MTYYEELGVEPHASLEEIRRAYRHLTRLVHPDQYADPESRRLAELQMRRLNSMVAVLGDGTERARYDGSLGRAARGTPKHLWRYGCGTAAMALLLALALWPRQEPAPAQVQPPAVMQQPKKTSPRRRTPSIAAPVRAVPEQPAPAVEETSIELPPVPRAGVPIPTLNLPRLPDVTPAVSETGPVSVPQLPGRWLFVPGRVVKAAGYPPEYIELRLSESAGLLHGAFQARYRVADRPISPNVAFRFDGSTESDGGVLPWKAADGSQGEVTLTLLSGRELEVAWVAHILGRELGLISGTATLVRRLE